MLRTQVRRYVHIPVWGGERDAHAAAKAQEARGDQAITRRQHRLASPHQKVRHALTVCTKLTNATAGVRRDGRRAPCRSVMLLCAEGPLKEPPKQSTSKAQATDALAAALLRVDPIRAQCEGYVVGKVDPDSNPNPNPNSNSNPNSNLRYTPSVGLEPRWSTSSRTLDFRQRPPGNGLPRPKWWAKMGSGPAPTPWLSLIIPRRSKVLLQQRGPNLTQP